jgi:hypothetical protein
VAIDAALKAAELGPGATLVGAIQEHNAKAQLADPFNGDSLDEALANLEKQKAKACDVLKKLEK